SNVVPGCIDGVCAYPCAPGWGRCPTGIDTPDCETALLTDPNNCGGCGNVCPTTAPNAIPASPTCQAGRCRIDCRSGWANCNGDDGDGCEVDITTTSDCGTCGHACASASGGGAACNAGTCELTCPSGYTLCGTTCVALCTKGPHVTETSSACTGCTITTCET